MRPLVAATLLALLSSGCTAPGDAQEPGPQPAATETGWWENKTLQGTAYAIAIPGGYAADPRDPEPHTFEVPAGAAHLEVLVQASQGGVSFTLAEPGCNGDPTQPTAQSGCEHRADAANGQAKGRYVNPPAGTWRLHVEPPRGGDAGPWSSAYTATVAVHQVGRGPQG